MLPNTPYRVPPRTCFNDAGASGKMCRHNLTGYISPNIEANLIFILADSIRVLLKYNGCQNSHCRKTETMLHLTDNNPNIPYKNRITTEKNEKNQNLQISESANAQINDV